MNIFKKGNHPKVLILSGMHGDEYGIIDHVSSYVSSHTDQLPDFLYIPKVSPTAVVAKTRVNALGHDINRSFTSPVTDAEVRAVTNVIKKHSFAICLDFHEDPDLSHECYFYDTGILSNRYQKQFEAIILGADMSVYSGMDDASDATLGFMINKGYVSMHDHLEDTDTGFASGWMIRHGVSRRVLTIEIPGKSSSAQKRALIHAIFPFFLQSEFMIQ